MSLKLDTQTIEMMQQKSWEIYRYFAEFCTEHKLKFFACGGCCIGAVRHGGFIPWDDDVDLFMPRDDYNQLLKIWNKYAIPKYRLIISTPDMITGDLMAKICDENTTLVTTYQRGKHMPHGLTMDILPLDGCPQPGSLARKIQKIYALLFSLYFSQTIPKNHGGFKAAVAKILLTIIPGKRLKYRLAKIFEKKMTKYSIADCEYLTELCSGPRYMQNEFPKEWFSDTKKLAFSDSEIVVPTGYNEYLSLVFGDYMTLPPEDKQVPHHEISFIDLNCSYRKYFKY